MIKDLLTQSFFPTLTIPHQILLQKVRSSLPDILRDSA